MKQIILPLIGTILFVLIVGIFTTNPGKYIKSNKSTNPQVESSNIVKINDLEISVEVADTSEKRAKGLSNRESLGEKEGMLFVFDENSTPTFWMKDMIMSIDIIWINDNKITQIDKNIEAPEKNVSDNELQRYSPETSIDYVLEVNSGFSDKYEIKVGDLTDLSLIK